MTTRLLTDGELRARWSGNRGQVVRIEEGTIITPAAKDFIREQEIQLQYTHAAETNGGWDRMHRAPIPVKDGKAVYVDAATGTGMSEKPEEMTHLRGNLLVPKTHPQIAFRGKLDTLMARMLCLQAKAQEQGESGIARDIGELLGFVRMILGAEVKDEPLPEIRLFGLDSAGIRKMSHDVKGQIGIDHPIPDAAMGTLVLDLNLLRAEVREVELSAACAFTDGENHCLRRDIVEGLNRLSSCVYIIFCRKLAGYYK